MSAATTSLFKPTAPQQPVATLILIENSQEMSFIWSDLRDQYLDKLVDNLVFANPSAPITVGYHDGLHDIKFNSAPENRISPVLVNSCINFLDSGKFQGQTVALHLIIVAATPPSDDNTAIYPASNSYLPWLQLAQKLAKKKIHLHIAVNPRHDMSPLTMLFEETLRLQNHLEEIPPFPLDPLKIVLRLSAKPGCELSTESASSHPYPHSTRRNSYPLDNLYFDDEGGNSPSSESDPPPSLVSQLQQVHGLTKKKVYGTKPTRQPFFRDERVRDKYRKVPTPLTMPSSVPEQIPSPTAGGKALSHSRAERMGRVGQASPTDIHPRRQHGWPARRGSRLSTPEPDNMSSIVPAYHDMSPGSSYVSSAFSSPVTPVTTIEDIYGVQPGIVQNPLSSAPAHIPAAMAAYQTGGMPEPSWSSQPQYHGGYAPHSQSYFTPRVPIFYDETGQLMSNEMPPPLHPHQQHQSPPSIVPSHHSPPFHSFAPPSPMLTPPMVPSQSYDSPMANMTTCISPLDSAVSTKPSQRTPKKVVTEDDDERFMFGKEFVAATAALFDAEVLPAYPNFPGMSSGLTSTNTNRPGSMPYFAPSQAGELYASRDRQSMHQAGPPLPATMTQPNYNPLLNTMNSSPFSSNYVSGRAPHTSSSLTGWAG
ncbi:hypothetical protein B0H34DRAFT_110557 [Crassisporium funariophilum]|nr:hypothetical protein B0H34DRAFT_110557 [Crassisporium funariophilum]